MSNDQKLISLFCLRCDRQFYGMLNGPMDSIRKEIWGNGDPVGECCLTEEEKKDIQKRVESYFNTKPR